MSSLIFNKCFDYSIADSFIDITADKKGNIFCLYQIDKFRYEVKCYSAYAVQSYLIHLENNVNIIRIIGDYFLLINSSSSSNKDNVFILDRGGQLINKFYAGAGIEACQVDRTDGIWIGYSDEGIFEEDAIGQDGILCFNSKGEILFNQYHTYVEKEMVPPIDHCNSITVDKDNIWITYYSNDYILIQMNKEYEISFEMKMDIPPIRCLAVGNKEAILVTMKDILKIYLSTASYEVVQAVNKENNHLNFHYFFTSENRLFGIENNFVYTLELT